MDIIKIAEKQLQRLNKENKRKLDKLLFPSRDISKKCSICGAEPNKPCILVDPIESIVFSKGRIS